MSDQPTKCGRGSSTFDRPDQPLTGGEKGTGPSKGQARDARFNSMLEFGEKLAGARRFGTEGVPRSFLARPPPPNRKPTTTEPKSSPLVHPLPSPLVGPSSSTPGTTIKRSLSSSRSPSPKKIKIESPPAASASTSASADATPAPTTITNDNDNNRAVRQPPAVALASALRCPLVNYPDSEDG